MHTWMVALLCTVAGCSLNRPGVPLDVGAPPPFGDGTDGSLEIPDGSDVINAYTPVTEAVEAGGTQLVVGDSAITQAGGLVLVWQTAMVMENFPVGDAQPIDLAGLGVGHYEFAAVDSIDSQTIQLTDGLANSYAERGAQVVHVPQYTKFTVEADATVRALQWNGQVGGIIVVVASEGVSVNGAIDASERGFRGGRYTPDQPTTTGCDGLDEVPPRGAERGEGLVLNAFDARTSGRGNPLNGGGGGNCADAGGGGGGHAQVGGRGGNSWYGDQGREVGGMGGAPLTYDLSRHLAPGGGGGTGWSNSESDDNTGGRGGGVILVSAPVIEISGRLVASGQDGGDSVRNNGGGGGGGGGAVLLYSPEAITCAGIDVTGGDGGQTNAMGHGPGAGGSPGVVQLSSSTTEADCPVVSSYGTAGTDGQGRPWGAQPWCGDMDISGDEQCDDGNRQGGDGCSAMCLNE